MITKEKMENDLVHTIGLISSEHKYNRNNFLPSTLHCLTNIKFLTNFINSFDQELTKDKEDEQLIQELTSYKNLLNQLAGVNDKKKFINTEEFEKALNYGKLRKENCNPKFLLEKILKEFNNYFVDKFKNTTLQENISISLQSIIKCTICKNYIEEDNKEEKKYLEFNFIDLYKEPQINEKEKIDVYDCLINYTKTKDNKTMICNSCKKETMHEIKTIFRKLPEILIIFVEYGNDKNFILEKEIEFNENLNFRGKEYVSDNLKNITYYLSSLICVREIMNPKKEYFYTFCKGNQSKDSKYFCYNGEKVYDVQNIENKLKKDQINLSNRKERFPYILIYTSYSLEK